MIPKPNKYIRTINAVDDFNGFTNVDVYSVLEAFTVKCPATQHAIKKLLCAGIRGQKTTAQDLEEARESITRAIQMEMQRQPVTKAKKQDPDRCGYHDERKKRCTLNDGHLGECEFFE